MNKFKRTTVATLLSVLCGAPAFAGGSETYTPMAPGAYSANAAAAKAAASTSATTSATTSSSSSSSSSGTASATSGSSTTATTTIPQIQGMIWPDQSYLKYYGAAATSTSGTSTTPHLGRPPGGLAGVGRSGSQSGNTPELVAITCDTCASFGNAQIEEDGAVAFWVNYLQQLWVEVIKPQSVGLAEDGVYAGVRMDGGTGGVALPLALPAGSGGTGGTWSLNVLGDVADLEAVTVYHVNIVTIGTAGGSPPVLGTTGNGGTYTQLALYVPAATPTLLAAGATPTTALYYQTNTATNVNTVTFLLSVLPPKSVVDFVYLVNFASGPYSLINNGQVDGRHAVPYYVTQNDCSLTSGYVSPTTPPAGAPPLGNINCTPPATDG